MKHVKIGVAIALAASLWAPTAVGTATADDSTKPPGVNARGMSPNADARLIEVDWGNAETAFKYFVDKGLTTKQAAGVLGNLIVESGMDPTIEQIGGGPGRGIAQWSAGGRWDTYDKDNNVWYAGTVDKGPKTLSAQLQFTWYELSTFSYYGLGGLKDAGSVNAAMQVFMTEYEGCGDCHQDRRLDYAQQAYDRFG